MNPIQKNWINFKTHFRKSHRGLEETGQLKTEDVGFHQSNPVNDMVSHTAGLPFPYPPQGCQEPIYAPTTTPISNYGPILAPIVQPAPAANATTAATSTIIPQLLTSMQHM